MNLIHPDSFYEHNLEYQKDRLEESQRARPFSQPGSIYANLKDRVFLSSGDLLIAIGKHLKSQAAHRVCAPQTI